MSNGLLSAAMPNKTENSLELLTANAGKQGGSQADLRAQIRKPGTMMASNITSNNDLKQSAADSSLRSSVAK